MAELRFRVGAIFPADNPTARYVMAVSITLGDIRVAGELADREEQPGHERLYFVRQLELHVREGLRLAIEEHRERDDVRRFVSILPDLARDARDRLERMLEAEPPEGFERLADPLPSVGDSDHLRRAMERIEEVESTYRIVGVTHRADYADLAVATTMLPDGEDVGDVGAMGARLRARLAPTLDPLTTFLEHAEAAWLRPWRG